MTSFAISDDGQLYSALTSSNTCALVDVGVSQGKAAWEFLLEEDSPGYVTAVVCTARSFTPLNARRSPPVAELVLTVGALCVKYHRHWHTLRLPRQLSFPSGNVMRIDVSVRVRFEPFHHVISKLIKKKWAVPRTKNYPLINVYCCRRCVGVDAPWQ